MACKSPSFVRPSTADESAGNQRPLNLVSELGMAFRAKVGVYEFEALCGFCDAGGQ
jgi:hypothetical protein